MKLSRFQAFQLTSQNAKTSSGGENHVLVAHIHTMVFINGGVLGNIITMPAISESMSQEPCTSIVLNHSPEECRILETCQAGIGSAL